MPEPNARLSWFEGRLQKGPFLTGSVSVRPLDERFLPTGEPWAGRINYYGKYTLEYGCADGPAEVEATGPFFNEVTGDSSWSQITLRAVVEISLYRRINVNVLTTLAAERIRTLAGIHGMPFAEAKRQAEAETLRLFGFPSEGVGPLEELDLTEDGLGNAMLLAASALLLQDRDVEELALLLERITTDLAGDGVIGDQDLLDELRASAMELNCAEVRGNLVDWLVGEQHQPEGVVPMFEAWLDSDGDGVLNRDEVPSVRWTDPSVLEPDPTWLLSEPVGELVDRLPVRIVFDAPMLPASLQLSGDLAAAAGEVVWSSVRFTNDTLTIHPALTWPAGEKTLRLNVESVFLRQLPELSLTFRVASKYAVYTDAGPDLMPTAAVALAGGDFAFSACCGRSGRHEVLVRMNPQLEVLQQFELPLDFHVLSIADDGAGGYVLAGTAASAVSLARFSGGGELVFMRLRYDIAVKTVVPDGQGGFLVCGSTRPDEYGDRQILLWGVDAAGATVSECTFNGSREDVCTDMIPSANGYLVTARTRSVEYGAGTNTCQALAIETDAQCNVHWHRGLGGFSDDYLDLARAASNGGYYLGGTTDSGELESTIPLDEDSWAPERYVVKLDEHGDILWQALFGSGGTDELQALMVTEDDGVLTLGRFLRAATMCPDGLPCASDGLLLVRLGADGQRLWQRTLAGGQLDRPPFSWVSATGHGTFVIASLVAADYRDNAALLLGGNPSGVWVFRLRDDGRIE